MKVLNAGKNVCRKFQKLVLIFTVSTQGQDVCFTTLSKRAALIFSARFAQISTFV